MNIFLDLHKPRTSLFIGPIISETQPEQILSVKISVLLFSRVLHTMYCHFRAHAFARSVTVMRSSAAHQVAGSRGDGPLFEISVNLPILATPQATLSVVSSNTLVD